MAGNNKTMRMLEVPDNKRSLKFYQQILLSNEYLNEQFGGGKLYKLVSKRKELPREALDVWKYNLMRQKNIFSEPLVHGKLVGLIQFVYTCIQEKKPWHAPTLILIQACVLT
jgi:cohesin complex subunit SCC1